MSVTFRKFSRSQSTMALVLYQDERTAYLWVEGAARPDEVDLMAVARERQAAGSLPAGVIARVRWVR